MARINCEEIHFFQSAKKASEAPTFLPNHGAGTIEYSHLY